MNDGISELAKLFIERDNMPYLGPQIGKVISPLPDIQISLGDRIVLTKENLVFSAHVLNDYQREFEIEGNIGFIDYSSGFTDEKSVGDHGAHKHSIESLSVDTNYAASGLFKYKDTLKENDEVILVPTQDEQIYFVIDKAVKF